MTLIEVMVASVIMLMIAGASYMILVNGMQLYRAYQDAIDAQQSGMAALRQVSDLMKASSVPLVNTEPADGVEFANPYKNDGRMGFDTVSGSPTEGKLLWQKYTCIYRDPVTQNLLRKDSPITPPKAAVPNPLTAAPPRDLAYFVGLSVTKRIVGTGIKSFRVYVDPLSAGNTYFVEMELGDMNDISRYGLLLKSQVTPRN